MIVGTGIDVASRERIGSLYEKHGERFLRRVFTEGERDYCLSFSEPIVHLAARFAAKEAAYKALGGVGPLRWKEMEIHNNEQGKPELTLHGQTLELARGMGVKRCHVSLTHDAGIAMAQVILEG